MCQHLRNSEQHSINFNILITLIFNGWLISILSYQTHINISILFYNNKNLYLMCGVNLLTSI